MVDINKYYNPYLVKSLSFLLVIVWAVFSLGCSAGDTGSPKITTTTTAASWLPEPDTLERITPEEAGYSSAALQDAHEFAQQSGCNAVMALYDGKAFFARGNVHKNYLLESLRMPLLSALLGIHFTRDNIDLDASLADLHMDDIAPGLTHAEKKAKVEHLLMSRSGVYHEAALEDREMIDTRPARGSHPPDTNFFYNNWDFNALGTIFEQETGEDIFKAFKKEIADMVKMVDFTIENCIYDYNWSKSMHPAYHFKMSVRDLAKFGALYQKHGKWNGSQVIPFDWIDESTMAYSNIKGTDGLGYGYMWKIIEEDSKIGQLIGSPGYYHTRADGYVLVVIPDLKLVIVEHYHTAQNWEDTDSDAFELGMLILDARLDG